MTATAAAAFLIAKVPNAAAVARLVDVLKKSEHVSAFGHFARLSMELFESSTNQLGDEAVGSDGLIVQALVSFDRTVIVSRLGVALCDQLDADILQNVRIGAIADATAGDPGATALSTSNTLYKWYFYHIAAGIIGVNVDGSRWIVRDCDLLWYVNGDGEMRTLRLLWLYTSEDFEELEIELDARAGFPLDILRPLYPRTEGNW
jgi:hypothetical protein